MPGSPFKKTPRAGHLRGIDFYNRLQLKRAIALSITNYKAVHGIFPNLIQPRGLNEKITWSKFFAELPVPGSGNKLLTSEFIPIDLKNIIKCPRILWHSTTAKLPSNDEVPPGVYYFKASHGSGMTERVSFPLTKKERALLEIKAQKWLSNAYGLLNGEWWYNAFEKEILLEEAVTDERDSTALMFHVFDGEVGLITFYKKRISGGTADKSMWFDPYFNRLPYQNEGVEIMEDIFLTAETKSDLKCFASRIGKRFSYVRVDFLLDKNEKAYLGELTFSPNNGLLRWPTELDMNLGNKWNLH